MYNGAEIVMGIGDLAKAAGMTDAAIRYHFRCGHLPEPRRRMPSGGRIFDKDEAERVLVVLEDIRRTPRVNENNGP